jgi:hypothetical protein
MTSAARCSIAATNIRGPYLLNAPAKASVHCGNIDELEWSILTINSSLRFVDER